MPEGANKAEYYVGVDLGGTKIYAGVFNHTLEIVGTARISTKAQRGAPAVIDRIARCVRDAVDECDLSLKQIKAVGVGAPGAVDSAAGTVIFAPNLEWKDVPLRKLLEKELEVPVRVENDCNAATLGVYEVELKSKPRYMINRNLRVLLLPPVPALVPAASQAIHQIQSGLGNLRSGF